MKGETTYRLQDELRVVQFRDEENKYELSYLLRASLRSFL